MSIDAVTESVEQAIPGTFSIKESVKIAGLFIAILAAFKMIEYFYGVSELQESLLDNESDDSYFKSREVNQIDGSNLLNENVSKVAGKSLINSDGGWEGEGTEGYYLDENGNDWYFNNRQPG